MFSAVEQRNSLVISVDDEFLPWHMTGVEENAVETAWRCGGVRGRTQVLFFEINQLSPFKSRPRVCLWLQTSKRPLTLQPPCFLRHMLFGQWITFRKTSVAKVVICVLYVLQISKTPGLLAEFAVASFRLLTNMLALYKQGLSWDSKISPWTSQNLWIVCWKILIQLLHCTSEFQYNLYS